METIRKTVESKYAPKQTNVTWVDLSGKTPVEKHFINGRWRPIGGGGSTNPGYNVTKQTVTLFNDTIKTRESGGIYQDRVENIDFDLIAGETYTVVFDGVSYDIEAISLGIRVFLGEFNNGPSFETYPFAILYTEQEGVKSFALATNIEGSYTVEIKHEEKTVTTTPEFKDAVDSITGYSIEEGYETICIENEIQAAQGSSYQFDSSFNLVIGDSYKVTFDGTEYQCICYADDYLNAIGEVYNSGYQWNEYPFSIDEQGGTVMGNFQTGTHNIKIEHLTTSTKTTPEFESMIHDLSNTGIKIIRINNYTGSLEYPNSTLIDVNGNEFHEGTDYTISYSNDSSNDPFEYIDTITFNSDTSAVLCANMIQIEKEEETGYSIYTRTIAHASLTERSNISYWGDSDSGQYVGWFTLG